MSQAQTNTNYQLKSEFQKELYFYRCMIDSPIHQMLFHVCQIIKNASPSSASLNPVMTCIEAKTKLLEPLQFIVKDFFDRL